MDVTPVMRPKWFLDIDGVINCWPAPNTVVEAEHGPFLRKKAAGYDIWFRPALVEFITRIHDEQFAEIIWTTTWQGDAARKLAPRLGLPKFDFVLHGHGEESWPGEGWWKLKRVQELAGGGPFVWTDDDIDATARTLAPMGGLIIAPAHNPGLTADHETQIEEFLRANSDAAERVVRREHSDA